MFRIRQISDDRVPPNRREIAQVQGLLRERLPGLDPAEIDGLPARIRDALAYQLQAMLFVAVDLRGQLEGFALLSLAPDVRFGLLEYTATESSHGSGGVGGSLYQRVRNRARELGAIGLFFECLPDDPDAVSDPKWINSNAARLRFYERFGARPIVGTAYEQPLRPGDLDMPYLVFDDLDSGAPLRRDDLRAIVRALLERKYAQVCSAEYVDRVVESIVDDPVRLRPPRYVKKKSPPAPVSHSTGERLIGLVVNRKHQIHRVRERGYVEAPVRVSSILQGLDASRLFWRIGPREYPKSYFNNAAVAAHYLSAWGKVAILDVDYHHGNGQQDIFWERGDVLTVSIHGHPKFAYPFFSGYSDEIGAGAGEGTNLNIPLPEKIEPERYRKALTEALRRIAAFAPRILVVCLGLDTARRDPTGTWNLTAPDFEQNGRMIAALGLPTLVVQEGGYRTVSLGANAGGFFVGLAGEAMERRR
jgi:hypothetical protein